MDADRIARLLDRIGRAVVVTHSASGSDGWLVADKRPGLVAAIVTVEPMGPAFAATPNIGTLDWGTDRRADYLRAAACDRRRGACRRPGFAADSGSG